MTDSRPVMSGVSSPSRETVIQTQARKLARCDEDLSLIASEMTQLQDELTQFRAYADELARRISEREASLDEKELALSRLEEERTLARQEADGVLAELRDAEAQLTGRDAQISTLERQLEALRTGIGERESRLADAVAELSGLRHAVPLHERTLEDSVAAGPNRSVGNLKPSSHQTLTAAATMNPEIVGSRFRRTTTDRETCPTALGTALSA